jgi:hypothetical protein
MWQHHVKSRIEKVVANKKAPHFCDAFYDLNKKV